MALRAGDALLRLIESPRSPRTVIEKRIRLRYFLLSQVIVVTPGVFPEIMGRPYNATCRKKDDRDPALSPTNRVLSR